MDADEITWITDQIAITNFYSAHQPELLAEHAVDAILCLERASLGNSAEERGVRCIELVDLVDGPNDMALFERAVSTLDALLKDHQRVVVHCRAGRSRSIAIVAGHLKRSRNWDATAALDFVKAKRESALAPELVRLVERLKVDS